MMTPRNQRRWQQTFNVDGHKILVVIIARTNVGNRNGYSAVVTDNQGRKMAMRISTLYMEDAQEIAYCRFVKALPGAES